MGSFKPVSAAINSVDEFISWTPDDSMLKRHSFITINSQLPPRKSKILVCHDMMDGYLEDKFDQGSNSFDGFNFWFWQKIDLFVYFSHRLISVPPFVWRVAAHRNDCPILATFIVEGNSGQQILSRLLDGANFSQTINKLVDLCHYYQFDGYLINIESDVYPTFVPTILKFLKELKERLLAANPRSLVIWYDSITCRGRVAYQDYVNYCNQCFLVSSSGFFTNYNWKPAFLDLTVENVGHRRTDVYVGVDVYPRFKCNDVKAFVNWCTTRARISLSYDLSLALFAVGYFYEVLGAENFYSNFSSFWQVLTHDRPNRVHSTFPFRSHFCVGRGLNYFFLGKSVSLNSFLNISLQQVQPNFNTRTICAQGLSFTHCPINTDVSYIGGSCACFSITQTPINKTDPTYIRFHLFSFDMSLPSQFNVQFVFKMSKAITFAVFALELQFYSNEYVVLIQDDESKVGNFELLGLQKGTLVIERLCCDSRIDAHFTGEHDAATSWSRLYATLRPPFTELRLKSINLLVIPLIHLIPEETSQDHKSVKLLLGGMSIFSVEDLGFDWSQLSYSCLMATNTQVTHSPKFILSTTLTWKLSAPSPLIEAIESFDLFCRIKDSYRFIGKCVTKGYYYIEEEFDKSLLGTQLYLYVQPVLRSGIRQPISSCTYISFSLE